MLSLTHHHVTPAVVQAGPDVNTRQPRALLHQLAGVDEVLAECLRLLSRPARLGTGQDGTSYYLHSRHQILRVVKLQRIN